MSDDNDLKLLEESDRVDGLGRRSFLKILTASFATLGLPGCSFKPPREKVVPYMAQPDGVVSGQARWYASTCGACPAQCGVLVKSLDGRPIKMEGMAEHPLSQGGLCARGQAWVLELYDSGRIKGPQESGGQISWSALDGAVAKALAAARASQLGIRILDGGDSSPAMARVISDFTKAHPTARHVRHQAVGAGALREAHRLAYGRAMVPSYRFDKAKVLVGVEADFLGTWLSPVEFTRAWSAGRRLELTPVSMSWHGQLESRLSVTGSNADLRLALAPSRVRSTVAFLVRRVATLLGTPVDERVPSTKLDAMVPKEAIEEIAKRLAAARGAALVVSGSTDVGVQVLVIYLNQLLESVGRTVDLAQPSLQAEADHDEVDRLIDEMARGEVGVLIVNGVNPLYDHPRAKEFGSALGKVPVAVSLSRRPDETSARTRFHAPDHHPLESWGDARPHVGLHSLYQPVIAPLFDTRSALESLALWSGGALSAHDQVRRSWRETVFAVQTDALDFETFWEKSVHDGVVVVPSERANVATYDGSSLSQARGARTSDPGDLELVVAPSHALYDGRHAHNPWLQELPDPVTKLTWGNCASISPATARKLGVEDGRVIALSADNGAVELPTLVQVGMPDGVVAVTLGHGSGDPKAIKGNWPIEKMFAIDKLDVGGANVAPLGRRTHVKVAVLGRMDTLARTQRWDSLSDPFHPEPRDIVREVALADLAGPAAPAHGSQPPAHGAAGKAAATGALTGFGAAEEASLWTAHDYTGPKWEMAIDLNACSGCSGCLVACQAENNVPVVGRVEVAKGREMHWIRIDRYFRETPASGVGPEVMHQPMLCQHCDNAPCETVCPALATAHSSDGLNMQVYNRCVGTRYCANNCPYKVRRFNWFDYAHSDLVQNLVLNPAVTVRSRGVMEKCSFCVQRIGEARRDAKAEDRPLADGDVRPACAQSCPAQAIVFGDANDPTSRLAKLKKDPRRFGVLTELGTRPAVHYLARIRHKKVT